MSKNSTNIREVEKLREKIKAAFSEKPEKGVLQGVRRFRSGKVGKRIVFFSSYKNKGMMPCESRLESDNCLNLEFDTTVVSYRVQPFTMLISQSESYTPDTVHVDRFGNYFIREVKFSGKLQNEILMNRLNKIKKIFFNLGIKFGVYTELDLQKNPQIQNYRFLNRVSHLYINDFQINLAKDVLLKNNDELTLAKFRNECEIAGLNPIVADKLIFLGIVKYDSKYLLTPNSRIWIMEGL